jgi:uncharacterized protein YndB with AHSA1/START domain
MRGQQDGGAGTRRAEALPPQESRSAEALPPQERRRAEALPAQDRSLVFHRRFRAPRELVFRAWTDSGHIARWWGPDGFTTTTREMDVRPGGVWRFTMHGPDGTDYPNRIVYLEVAPPERLVYKHDPDKDDEPVSFTVTVTFEQQGPDTALTMSMEFPSRAALLEVCEKYGAEEGAVQTLGRLTAYVEQLATQPPKNA